MSEARGIVDKAIDPVCGAELDKRFAKNMLFKPEATFYFCSKDCQAKFKPGFHDKSESEREEILARNRLMKRSA